MNIFYVYEHWRPDKDICFYVGKGKGARAYQFKRGRNRHYTNIIKKLARLGLCAEVRIVQGSLIEAEAFLLEINRIAFWRSMSVKLSNSTNGGEGISGFIHSEKSKARMSAKVRIAQARPEYKEKRRATLISTWARPEIREKQIAAMKAAIARPGIHEKQIAAIKIAQAQPEYKERQQRALKAAKALPKYKEKHRAACTTLEYREKQRTRAKAVWAMRKATQEGKQ